jgi:type II restriction/modification system DNA methylase subunit YeeA
VDKLEKELRQLRHRYFRIRSRSEKEKLQKKDKEIREKIAKALVQDGWDDKVANKIASFDLFDQNATADWFDPEWMFGVVDGFDIVIGNPPYVRQEKIRHLKPSLQQQKYQTFTSTADLYVYFYEKGHQLLKDAGILSFISSNKWMRAKYGENLRKFLKNNTAVLKIIDFSGYRVFEQTVDTNIILFSKGKPADSHSVNFVEIKSDMQNVIEYINQNWQTILQVKFSDNAWTLADENVLALKEKIERIGRPLKDWDVRICFGIKTGYNEAFIIDTETRNRILANCKDEEERKRTEEIIKPVLRGRDIGKYYYKWAGLWIIGTFPAKHINIVNYPSLREYLRGFGDKLLQDGKPGHRKKASNKWFETQDNIAYYPEFEKEKIVFNKTTKEDYAFAYDFQRCFVNQSTYIMVSGKYPQRLLLGILNSQLFRFAYRKFYSGGGIEGEITVFTLENFPLPLLTPQNQPIANQIITLVDQILSAKKQNPEADTSKLEHEIDQLVYALYDLTEEEIEIIGERKQK